MSEVIDSHSRIGRGRREESRPVEEALREMDAAGIAVSWVAPPESDDFVTVNTSLVDAEFRVFLADGNIPLTPKELAEKISRPADTILRTLSGPAVYKGLRPYKS